MKNKEYWLSQLDKDYKIHEKSNTEHIVTLKVKGYPLQFIFDNSFAKNYNFGILLPYLNDEYNLCILNFLMVKDVDLLDKSFETILNFSNELKEKLIYLFKHCNYSIIGSAGVNGIAIKFDYVKDYFSYTYTLSCPFFLLTEQENRLKNKIDLELNMFYNHVMTINTISTLKSS